MDSCGVYPLPGSGRSSLWPTEPVDDEPWRAGPGGGRGRYQTALCRLECTALKTKKSLLPVHFQFPLLFPFTDALLWPRASWTYVAEGGPHAAWHLALIRWGGPRAGAPPCVLSCLCLVTSRWELESTTSSPEIGTRCKAGHSPPAACRLGGEGSPTRGR